MKAMNVGTAIKSECFFTRPCHCGKCNGYDHVNLVSKTELLLDVRDTEVQSFCSMAASYVKVTITFHCNLVSRSISASCEVRNPSGDLVLRTAAHSVPHVLVSQTEAGEAKLFALLRIKSALYEAARRRRAA